MGGGAAGGAAPLPGISAPAGASAAGGDAARFQAASQNAPATQSPGSADQSQSVTNQEGRSASEGRLPPASNQFQDFVAVSTGRVLPLFGYRLFDDVPTTFAPVDHVPVTPEYIVGPGDEVVIRVWGQVDVDFSAPVSREGTITIPKVGVVTVAGLRYQDLQPHLKNEFSRLYRNFEMTASLGRLRSMQIYVVGQARRPGTYTVSALSTLVNAVFAVGGPNGKGSMRRVQLKRNDAVVTEFDFYDLLQHGDKSRDVRLLPGDVIFFPPVGPLVAMAGSVNNPAIFELKGATATIKDVLGWAGGFTTVAGGKVGLLERIEAGTQRRVEDFSTDERGLLREVRDGDVISFGSITPRYENAVSLKGFVAAPGRYPYRPGMRVRDLLPDTESLISRDFWVKRNEAGVRDLPGGQALKAEVTRVEEINWDYAVIERVMEDKSVTLLNFNLGRAVLEGDPQHNLLLAPNDIITVFSKNDIRVSRDKLKRYITLEGEFAVPGVYEVRPGETLRQLVSRAGGFARSAYLYGGSFTRESVRAEQQRRLNEAVERLEKDFQRATMERSQAAATKDQLEVAQSEVAAQRAFISGLRQMKPLGRIVLELPRDSMSVKDLPELELENGDRFFVPYTPSTVTVFGAVFNENSFVYRKEKRLGDYLAQAGGPNKNADTGSLYLLRADGSVVSKQQDRWLFGGLDGERMMPGDAIVVPESFERFNFLREAKSWTEIFYQFALGVAGLRVLKNGVN